MADEVWKYLQQNQKYADMSKASTQPPTTTTPPKNHILTVDEFDEYSDFIDNDIITEEEIICLQNYIRKGLGIILPDEFYKEYACKYAKCKPKLPPRHTVTSRTRIQMHVYRILRICSAIVQKIDPEDEEVWQEKLRMTAHLQSRINELRNQPLEETQRQNDDDELEQLRQSAASLTKTYPIRENKSSLYRRTHLRHEPVLSDSLRKSLQQYKKPPWNRNVRQLSTSELQMRPIDRKHEIWLNPEIGAKIDGMTTTTPKPETTTTKPKYESREAIKLRKRPPLKAYTKPSRPEIDPKNFMKSNRRLKDGFRPNVCNKKAF